VDVVPSPPPHGAASPRLAESVGVAGLSVRHRDDGLSVVFVALAEGALGGAQVGGFDTDAAVDLHRAEPLQGTRWLRRWRRRRWFRRSFLARLLIARKMEPAHAGASGAVTDFVAVVIASSSRVRIARMNFANGLFPGAFVPHLVDIPPVPPPHGSASPSFGQRVGVSSSSVRHRDDGLSVVLVSTTKRALCVT